MWLRKQDTFDPREKLEVAGLKKAHLLADSHQWKMDEREERRERAWPLSHHTLLLHLPQTFLLRKPTQTCSPQGPAPPTPPSGWYSEPLVSGVDKACRVCGYTAASERVLIREASANLWRIGVRQQTWLLKKRCVFTASLPRWRRLSAFGAYYCACD